MWQQLTLGLKDYCISNNIVLVIKVELRPLSNVKTTAKSIPLKAKDDSQTTATYRHKHSLYVLTTLIKSSHCWMDVRRLHASDCSDSSCLIFPHSVKWLETSEVNNPFISDYRRCRSKNVHFFERKIQNKVDWQNYSVPRSWVELPVRVMKRRLFQIIDWY